MRRLILSLIVSALAVFFMGYSFHSAYAFDPLATTCASQPDSVACDTGSGGDPIGGDTGIIKRVAVIIATITGVASIVLIIIGAIKYMTSGGDPNAVNSAKNTILYALVGAVVTVFAQAIIIFVINKI